MDYMTSDILEDIKKEILQKLPNEIQVSKVEFEGPEVVVYTKNPEIITENGDLIRSLAKELRKRINKDIPDEKIFSVIKDAVKLDFNIKLYFLKNIKGV